MDWEFKSLGQKLFVAFGFSEFEGRCTTGIGICLSLFFLEGIHGIAADLWFHKGEIGELGNGKSGALRLNDMGRRAVKIFNRRMATRKHEVLMHIKVKKIGKER